MYTDRVRALNGLALPRASHSGEIALSGSRRLYSTLATVPVFFAHAIVIVVKNCVPLRLVHHPCAHRIHIGHSIIIIMKSCSSNSAP